MKRTLFLLLLISHPYTAHAQNYLHDVASIALGFYQHVLSPIREPAGHCQFSPSCSEYAKLAVQEYGIAVGSMLASDRLMRCGTHAHQGDYPYDGKLFIDLPSQNYLFGSGGLWRLASSRSSKDPDSVVPLPEFSFAYDLYRHGDFDYSVIELKRLQFQSATNDLRNYANALIAIDFLSTKEYKKAQHAIDQVDINALTPQHRQNTFVLNYRIADAQEHDEWNSRFCMDTMVRSELPASTLQSLQAYALTKAGEDVPAGALISEEARRIVRSVQASGPYSPTLAGIMSAIIPGSGYMYLGKFGQGFSALAFNGLFGWGIYSLIKNHNYGTGILLGSFAIPFYLGSIAGSTNAAMMENGKSRQLALGALRTSLNLDLYFSINFLNECWK